MADNTFPKSGLPIRRSVELLPVIFQTPANDKFLSAVVDPLIQPGVLDKAAINSSLELYLKIMIK